MTLNQLIENQGEMEYIKNRWGLRNKQEVKEHLAKYGIVERKDGELCTTEREKAEA